MLDYSVSEGVWGWGKQCFWKLVTFRNLTHPKIINNVNTTVPLRVSISWIIFVEEWKNIVKKISIRMGEEYKRLDNRAAHLEVIFFYTLYVY